ncbi:MAG: hypothetical protein CL758_04495 [Chloroflexi bacterium]|nr:hypothetical protein [Chloroflexota bacterium]
MLNKIWTKVIYDQKLSLIFWNLILIGISLLIMSMYPSIKLSGDALDKAINSMPKEMVELFYGGEAQSITTPIGWLSMELYGLILPFALIIYGVTNGINAIAGEEKNGTLELLLTLPISRVRLASEKFFSLVLGLLIIIISFSTFIIIFKDLFDLEFEYILIVIAGIELFSLALVLSSIGFALGTSTGNKSISVGLTYTITIFSYLWNGLVGLVSGIENLNNISVFYYYSGLKYSSNRIDLVEFFCILLFSLLIVSLSIFIFNRRDIRTY